ncbi:unnamed protein product [Rhodiola kirilowii]
MNTPERNQIAGSRSKFEDSPVFNYLSNLSPIQPVKSAPITQSFTSLNFSSLPSIFTSPHVSGHEESKFLRRHNTPSKTQSDFSYIDASSNKENEVFVDVNQLQNCSHKESSDSESLREARLEPLSEESDPQIELSQNIRYNSVSPESDSKACHSTGEAASHLAKVATLSAMFDQGPSTSGPAIPKALGGWDSDGTDLLMFDSPNIVNDLKELFKSPPLVRVGSSLASHIPQDNLDLPELDSAFLVDIGELQNEGHYAETERIDCNHNDHPTMIECPTSHASENVVDEPMTTLHRGVRRRCLVFDTNAAHRKSLLGASNSNPFNCMRSDQKVSSNSRKPVTSTTAGSSSLRILSGIGLHLNTLATSGDSGVHVSVGSAASFQSPTIAQESHHDIFTGVSSEKNAGSDVAQGSEDDVLGPGLVHMDDFNQNSASKKRRKSESSGDESCKHCNCKKSKCLKLYCECFAAGVYCIGTCACQDCFNKPIHEETVLSTRKQIESRNPLAFAPKVIRTSDSIPDVKDEVMNTPASARHKRGCNCKKSSCQKKYCECYQGGVGCSINCRCETCKNVFGTKDGSATVASQDDYDEEEIEKVEKKMKNKGSTYIKSQNYEEHNPNTLPATPLGHNRMSVQLPFSSKGKPPISSLLIVGSASGLRTNQKSGKQNYFNPPPKFQRNYSAGQEEFEIPEMLRSNSSPNSMVKTSSPNSKRVSSPQSKLGSSSARRSTRKLILQSIPSFPSLTQP